MWFSHLLQVACSLRRPRALVRDRHSTMLFCTPSTTYNRAGTIAEPSQNHHTTITEPSRNHHGTITEPSQNQGTGLV